MEPQGYTNDVDEITGTTARWFMANAIPITKAEFEQHTRSRKKRGTAETGAPVHSGDGRSKRSARDISSVAPSFVDEPDDESPTFVLEPSHLTKKSEKQPSRKLEPRDDMDTSLWVQRSAPRKSTQQARLPVPPPPRRAKNPPRPDHHQRTVEKSAAVRPVQQATQRQTTAKPENPAEKARPHPFTPSSPKPYKGSRQSGAHLEHPAMPTRFERLSSSNAGGRSAGAVTPFSTQARAVPKPPLPPVPRQRAVSPDIQLRPQGLIAPVAMEEHRNPVARYRTRTQRRATPWRTWIWNSGSIAALFILVLIGRFLIADPSVTPTAGTVPEGHGEVTTANAGLQVETVRLNAQSPATTATTALLTIPASTSTNGKARQSATRYESMPQKLDTAQRSRRASRQLYGATKTGTLRINSRPWSQVFVDGRSVGTTPQMGLRLQAGRHTVKLVNRSFRLSKTITVELKPGQTVSEIVNLIE